MAVKWAVANGNWNVGATWNDGIVPAVGDKVYLDGHVVTLNVNPDIGSGTISNKTNEFTGLSGGHLQTLSSAALKIIIANIEIGSSAIIYLAGPNIAITGNIIGSEGASGYLLQNSASSVNLTITGNIRLTNANLMNSVGNTPVNLTIVGNILTYKFLSVNTATINNVTISGNIVLNSTEIASGVMSNLVINGNAVANNTPIGSATNFTINGTIEYSGVNPFLLVKRMQTQTISNPTTFVCKDVTEPRSNPFIILTDAEMNNHQQYPQEDEVKEGTEYVWGEKVGTYQQPPESVVLKDYVYDNGDKVGSLENQNIVGCVTPEDVRKDVSLVGMGVVGSLVVPSVDDVREGVVFDNGSVGTLIVQGGGDRLRIADFGYYTRSTSITYIVDLTESDKPAFADCEEIVLRSLFPTLDLDNIPDKFFDDLFVQFLRYRLLVEYYRGTSINSKFTPSEPTAEIVNYANTKCEYWLNTANLFLQLWGEKYPNSVKKDRFLL